MKTLEYAAHYRVKPGPQAPILAIAPLIVTAEQKQIRNCVMNTLSVKKSRLVN